MDKDNNVDFIDEYSKSMLEHIPANSNWAEDIAITLLSTVCSKINYATNKGRIPLNVWYITIAPSSAMKSLPLREYLEGTLRKMIELNGNQAVDLQLPSGFTPESMTKWLSSRQVYGIIVRDEVSTLFKETSGKGYTVQLQEFLSKLYDGRVEPRFTNTHGYERVDRCYVTLIGATTPYLYGVLEQQIFIQGLGSRVLWETFKKDYTPTTSQREFGDSPAVIRARNDILREFAVKLLRINSLEDIGVVIKEPSKAATLLVDFKNKLDQQATEKNKEDKLSLEALYLSKCYVHLLKLSALKAISRSYNVLKEGTIIEINEEDVIWATGRINRYISNFGKMMLDWRTQPIREPITSDKNLYDSILGVFKRDGYATLKEIQSTTGIYFNKVRPAIDQLVIDDIVKNLNTDEIRNLDPSVLLLHNINMKKQIPAVFKIIEN